MSYNYKYPRPALTVDCIIFQKTEIGFEILLIKRKNSPYSGKWAFPGGFVDMNEELHFAAARELKEETNISGIELKQLITVGTIGRDPRGRTVSVIYWGITNTSENKVHAGDDASNAKWFPVNKIPALAFDHDDIIMYAV
ncbi:MAG: NUDIX hydrolase, partial [Bacteroidales bacterium]|nr:NUDIX hydrolase [Bacteroidales bacterium]